MKKFFLLFFILFLFLIKLDAEDVEVAESVDLDLSVADFPDPAVFGIDEISRMPEDYREKTEETYQQKIVPKVEPEQQKLPATKLIQKRRRPRVKQREKKVEKKNDAENELRMKYWNMPVEVKKNGVDEIQICTTLPKTGTASVIGKEIFFGMNLAFNKINKKGGIKGSTIKLYFYDDKSSFALSSENIKKLKKTSPLFISLFGLSRMYAIEPYMKEGKAFDLFPVVGSSIVRDKSDPNVIYFRASEKKEIEKLIDYSVKKQNKKAISIFYERSECGQSAYEYARDYLKEKYNLPVISVGSYSEYTVNVLNAIKEISQRIPSSILCVASARATYNFIRRAINSGLYNCLFLGLSRLNVARKTLSEARGVKIVTSSVVPNPKKSKLLVAKQYRSDMKKYFPTKNLSRFSFEGYINAQILIQVLKGLKEPVTTAKIFNALQKLKKMKFRGLKLSFGVEPRTLSPDVWLEED